ncbi:MAG: metalloregulator ArsR/SmtB family transcription factor [Candidatus Solibacter sp.]
MLRAWNVRECVFVIAQIREGEYSNVMPNQLRAYKASVFHALAHSTRIAIVETLRNGELSAGALQARLGIEQANLSQHLAILRASQIVINRKGGNQVFYSLSNPVLGEVLDTMRRFCQTNLNHAIQMIDEMNREAEG